LGFLILRREKRQVPFILTSCLREVERRGINEVGIYRVSGSTSDVSRLKKAFETSWELTENPTPYLVTFERILLVCRLIRGRATAEGRGRPLGYGYPETLHEGASGGLVHG